MRTGLDADVEHATTGAVPLDTCVVRQRTNERDELEERTKPV